MRIAILGAGFVGLSAALKLLKEGHEVVLIEKESTPGGLAGGFKEPGWEWTLEKSYHHWFTGDDSVLKLAKEVGQKVIIKRPQTNVLVDQKTYPFDSPLAVLKFPCLPLVDKLRVGLATGFLRYLSPISYLNNKKALPWLKNFMGQRSTDLIWDPLFTGKFGKFKDAVALIWFWARIKKRTPKLAYPEGGFQAFADKLAKEIEKLGGQILFKTEVTKIISTTKGISLTTNYPLPTTTFDKLVVTLPTPIFTKITPNLPQSYVKRINSIPHLSALNLILILKKPFFKDTYWLNITDKDFPFLVLAEHTNFMDSNHYGNQHILYIGNYLPSDHPYLKMSPKQLLKIFSLYLKRINPNYTLYTIRYTLFSSPFAQPVVTPDYPKLIPEFQTPLENVYLANMDMVYPWDRGTNYAVEMGEKVAKLVV